MAGFPERSTTKPMPEPTAPLPTSVPRRLLTRLVIGVIVAVTLLVGLLWVAGLNTSRSFLYLGIGALMALVACLLWELVERKERQRNAFNPLAWVAFPGALLLSFGQIPFLALAVYPDLAEFLEPSGRLEAYWDLDREGRRLNIWFPRRVEQGGERSGNNLNLSGQPVPEEYYRTHPEHFLWIRPQTLSVAIEPVAADLGLGDITWIGVNTDLQRLGTEAAAWPYRYEDGSRVPAQTVVVR